MSNGPEPAIGRAHECADGRIAIRAAAWGPLDSDGIRYATAAIKTTHRAFPSWARAIIVTVRDRNGAMDVVGIQRPYESHGRK